MYTCETLFCCRRPGFCIKKGTYNALVWGYCCSMRYEGCEVGFCRVNGFIAIWILLSGICISSLRLFASCSHKTLGPFINQPETINQVARGGGVRFHLFSTLKSSFLFWSKHMRLS